MEVEVDDIFFGGRRGRAQEMDQQISELGLQENIRNLMSVCLDRPVIGDEDSVSICDSVDTLSLDEEQKRDSEELLNIDFEKVQKKCSASSVDLACYLEAP